ncbi:Dihydroorotate dehydrogenase (quinone) mitochondrial [Bienertia sinuspersici]
MLRGRIPLIGVGGVGSGEEAYKKIRAGATLVQLYTAFAYGGPALIPQMKHGFMNCKIVALYGVLHCYMNGHTQIRNLDTHPHPHPHPHPRTARIILLSGIIHI